MAGAEQNAKDYDKAMADVKIGAYQGALPVFARQANDWDSASQNNLGVMYEKGQGVPMDYALAYMWYNLAAAIDDLAAKKSRDELARKMPPTQIAEAQAMSREWAKKNPYRNIPWPT